MSKNNDITKEDLNSALWHISRDARRKNRVLGLDTLYEKDGYLVKEDPSGKLHKIRKLDKKKASPSPRVVTID
jgi:hypothetical protein